MLNPYTLQYVGVLETCLALRYWFFEGLGSESVKMFLQSHCIEKETKLNWFHIIVASCDLLASLMRVSIPNSAGG